MLSTQRNLHSTIVLKNSHDFNNVIIMYGKSFTPVSIREALFTDASHNHDSLYPVSKMSLDSLHAVCNHYEFRQRANEHTYTTEIVSHRKNRHYVKGLHRIIRLKRFVLNKHL